MLSDLILMLENVSKEYPCSSTRREMFCDLLFPYRFKNRRYTAVHPLSLQVRRGECLGIMGVNGSGKSTLSRGLRDITGLPLFHLDNIWWKPDKSHISREEFDQKLDEILRTIISKGCGIELNTGGFHYGLGEPNPCRAVIRRYRQLGGEIITVGTDAHKTQDVGSYLDLASEILQLCGFKYYTIYEKRSPEYHKL